MGYLLKICSSIEKGRKITAKKRRELVHDLFFAVRFIFGESPHPADVSLLDGTAKPDKNESGKQLFIKSHEDVWIPAFFCGKNDKFRHKIQ